MTFAIAAATAATAAYATEFEEYDFENIADAVRLNRVSKKSAASGSSGHAVNSEAVAEVNSKCEKALKMRARDSRYALKNRRTVNKDWKDFNNAFY
jgi:hypothetical protein